LETVTFRPATAQDAHGFYGKAPDRSFRGLAAVKDGEVIGVGGVYYDDFRRPVIFSEYNEVMAGEKRARAKAVRLLLQFAERLYPRVFAIADPRYDTSGPLLKKLGFVGTGEMTEMGELLVREKR
jgi:hypothetical protein